MKSSKHVNTGSLFHYYQCLPLLIWDLWHLTLPAQIGYLCSQTWGCHVPCWAVVVFLQCFHWCCKDSGRFGFYAMDITSTYRLHHCDYNGTLVGLWDKWHPIREEGLGGADILWSQSLPYLFSSSVLEFLSSPMVISDRMRHSSCGRSSNSFDLLQRNLS